MRLTAIFLLCGALSVSAKTFSQRVTFQASKATLDKVFTVIRDQTGYFVVYNAEVIERTPAISIKATNMPLADFLSQALQSLPLTYTMEGKTITIREKTSPVIATEAPMLSITGVVRDGEGQLLTGATVRVKGKNIITLTDASGRFSLTANEGEVLVISFVGYETREMKLTSAIFSSGQPLNIVLAKSITDLDSTVVIVNTGYQSIPKERATGSFAQVDNELFNRRVSTNILDRLEGVTSGLRFQTNIPPGSTESPISIRGRSTILSSTDPLIILDNFPYDGDITNLNPNDIESVTVLKDAAASSIWGARSSNGVIVITSKKGRANQPIRVDFNANVTVGQKPDLYYSKSWINSSDFIGFESLLFSKGVYDAAINDQNSRPVLSPVVEILNKRRAGLISATDSAAQIDALRNIDARDDYSKYFYQGAINQQYAVTLSGGTNKLTYRMTAGMDDNRANLIRNTSNRFTISNMTTYKPIENLEVSMVLSYIQNNNNNNNTFTSFSGKGQSVPYNRLVNPDGTPAVITADYRQAYKDTTQSALDWDYRPLQELQLANNKSQTYDIRIAPGIRYAIIKGLFVDFKYQYEKQTGITSNLYSPNSYMVRNLINKFYNPAETGVARFPVPLGGILNRQNDDLTSKRLRTQLIFDKAFSSKHQIAAIAGIETGEVIRTSSYNRLYGYNDDISSAVTTLDFVTRFPQYQNIASASTISNLASISKTTDEQVSYFTNASYTYNSKYIFSGSARIDQSNIFGVDFNQKGVPLWSVGGAWKLSDEKFYHIPWLPYAKLRITYGYNGNANKSVGALLTIKKSQSAYGFAMGDVNNPPNANLRWERIGMINYGLDFGTKNSVITGSIEYYHRDSKDLIGTLTVAGSSGLTGFTANVASMKGDGVDLVLRSLNIRKDFSWITDFQFSYSTNEVTQYRTNYTPNNVVANANTGVINPVIGKPMFSVYSYYWAGLDPNTGDPRGYLNKQPSNAYSTLLNPTSLDSVIYNGPGRPPFFGSVRNTFSYKGVSISANITYKLGYYFRNNTISYGGLVNSYIMNSDYSKRWQKPGDEKITNVPSFVYPVNSSRDDFYARSEINVYKGDHIRLQDIQISYDLQPKVLRKLHIQNFQVYVYANNLGVIWKANDISLDPDYLGGYPPPKTLSFGIRTSF